MSRATIDVELHLLPTSEGGKAQPLRSGYRSIILFEGAELPCGFELELVPELVDGLAPGASTRARLLLWAVAEATPFLLTGKRFELREGDRIVGRGVIVDSA